MARHNQYVAPVRSKTPAGDPVTAMMWRGYEDYRRGRGYAPGFEKMIQRDQVNYEAGRRAGACLKPFMPRHRLPAWPKDVEFPSILPATMPEAAVDAFLIENDLTARGQEPP